MNTNLWVVPGRFELSSFGWILWRDVSILLDAGGDIEFRSIGFVRRASV